MDTVTGCVLVVDDDPGACHLMTALMSTEGYHVVAAEDGLEALHLLRTVRRRATRSPCLVLLDLQMPRLGGSEFRRAQLGDPALSSVPVAIVSGAVDAAERAKHLGAVASLTKPIDAETLLTVVRRFCL